LSIVGKTREDDEIVSCYVVVEVSSKQQEHLVAKWVVKSSQKKICELNTELSRRRRSFYFVRSWLLLTIGE
jgi:hypothetical protein